MDLVSYFDKQYSTPGRTRVSSVRIIGIDNQDLKGRGVVVGDSVSLGNYLRRHATAKKVRLQIVVTDCLTAQVFKHTIECKRTALNKFGV